MRNLSAAML